MFGVRSSTSTWPHTIDISELRLSKAYTRSFALRRISLINDATRSECVQAHQRGHPTMISPKIKTAIRQKGLRCASAERHSEPLRSQLNTMGRVQRVFRVCVCRNVLVTSNAGRGFGFAKATSPPMGGQKMKLRRSTSRFAHPHWVHWRTTWRFSHSK